MIGKNFMEMWNETLVQINQGISDEYDLPFYIIEEEILDD
jgi:hypothetical protein|tara:strand:+ start:12028 stop:12147 length:120 start_codon:yes stop_codon:yes gene_type:complete